MIHILVYILTLISKFTFVKASAHARLYRVGKQKILSYCFDAAD